MKRTFTIALVFSCFFLCHAQETDLTVKSKIERVTVFLEGAQVTRLGTVSLKPGVSLLTFPAIAPGIQEQSIQAEAPLALKFFRCLSR